MSTRLDTTHAASVCTVTLHPPEGKPPTLDHALMGEFERALDEISARTDLSVVILQSASPKFFCAGANLKVMETIDRQTVVPWVERGHRLMNRIESLPMPTVARVEGYALGGGLELAMACDVIFASDNARFGQSETKLGFVTGWGGSYRLTRRVGLARAKELVFSGRIIEAMEAVRMGVAEWHGSAAELERRVTEFASAVVGNGRVAVREMKSLLEGCTRTSLEENAALEAAASQRCLIEGDAAERLRNFLHKRSSGGPTAQK
ncbi:MAG: enoyl-CoA hydratase/isomerase family protein [Opitutaceae bacterium]|nr:enoyl-CoA hydratase/isomerase family protein [Opitutaceae bacterium]